MVNKVRNIHFFSNTKFQQEYENRFYSKVPKCEDYVDKLEIKASSPYVESRFKEGLKEAIKHIRVFLLNTRLMTATDFTKAFLSLADSGYVQHLNKNLKFYEKSDLEDMGVDGFYDYLNMNISLSDKLFASYMTQEQTVKVLVHELMHYFVMTFNVEYNIIDNLKIKLSRKESPLAKFGNMKDLEYIEKELLDNYGKAKSSEPIKSPVLSSTFINEGYNELLSQLIYPKGNKTYYAQVKMVELLQFVTEQNSDYEGFFRWELGNQVKSLGEYNFDKFISYTDKYQVRYSKHDSSNYLTDNDYLAAQNLLVNHYVTKAINQYKKDKDASECINKVLSMFSYIPSIQKENVDVIKSVIKSTQPNITQEYETLMDLMDRVLEYKSQFHGKPIQLELNADLNVEVSRNFKNELNIYINGKVIDNQNIVDMIENNNGFKVLNLRDISNKKMIDIIKSNNGLQMFICDIKGNDYINRVQLDINFDRLEKENIVTYKEDYQKSKQIQLQNPAMNYKIDELIYFATHVNDIKAISNKISLDDIRKIHLLSPHSEQNERGESVYLVEDKKGVFEFYSKFKNTNLTKLNILNGIFVNGNVSKRQVYKTFLVENEETGKLENGVVQCDEIPSHQSEIIYVLENGTIIEVFNKSEKEKNILTNKHGVLNRPKLTCLYSFDNELIDIKEIFTDKTTSTNENE